VLIGSAVSPWRSRSAARRRATVRAAPGWRARMWCRPPLSTRGGRKPLSWEQCQAARIALAGEMLVRVACEIYSSYQELAHAALCATQSAAGRGPALPRSPRLGTTCV